MEVVACLKLGENLNMVRVPGAASCCSLSKTGNSPVAILMENVMRRRSRICLVGALIQNLRANLVGGWATPLKSMSSSIGMMKATQYEWENAKFMATKPPTRWVNDGNWIEAREFDNENSGCGIP